MALLKLSNIFLYLKIALLRNWCSRFISTLSPKVNFKCSGKMADWIQRSEKKRKYRKYQGIKRKRGMPFVSAVFQQFVEDGRIETCWWLLFCFCFFNWENAILEHWSRDCNNGKNWLARKNSTGTLTELTDTVDPSRYLTLN